MSAHPKATCRGGQADFQFTLDGNRVPAEIALAATLVHPGDTLLSIIERSEMLLLKSEQSGNHIAIDAE